MSGMENVRVAQVTAIAGRRKAAITTHSRKRTADGRRARGPVGQPPDRSPAAASVPRGNLRRADPDGCAAGRQSTLHWSPRSNDPRLPN